MDSKLFQFNKHKMFVSFLIFAAGLGGILYGYDIGVISGALLFVQQTIPMTPNETGFIVGAVLSGGLVGTFISGPLADRFGRRTLVLLSCLIFLLGIISILFAMNFWTLLFARLLLGTAVGVVAVTIPLYLGEIVPANMRGRSITIFQLLLTFGIVLAYFVDLLFTPSGNWRGMFAVLFIPVSLLLIFMLFLPESPRWLLANGLKQKAEQVLLKIKTKEKVAIEIKEIELSLKETKSSWKALFAKNFWLPLFVSAMIAICNQLTGINVLLQYAPLVIKQAGLQSNIATMFGTIGIGTVNFLGTILALFLIDRYGRRLLLIAGTIGVTISYVYLGFLPHLISKGNLQAELALIGLISYIFFFAIGPGVVVWLAISELMPTKVRGRAIALCLFLNSLAAAVLSTFFLTLENLIGMSNIYWLFAAFTFIYFLVVFFLLPETKGKTLEEIQFFYQKKKALL